MAAINNRRESNFLIKSVKGFDEKFESRGDFTGNRKKDVPFRSFRRKNRGSYD